MFKHLILLGVPALLVCCGGFAQSASQPVKEKVLLLDEFTNPDAGWPSINHGDTATAKVSDGNYMLDARKAARFWALRLGIPSGLEAAPTILEMKMKVTTDVPRADYGILWHTTQASQSTYNEWAFLVSSTGLCTISFQRSGAKFAVKDWGDCAAVRKNDYNVLRIEQGDAGMYRFFVNAQLVYAGKLPDAELTTLGFYSDAHTSLAVDYLKLAVAAQ